jgi:hypothetical protein
MYRKNITTISFALSNFFVPLFLFLFFKKNNGVNTVLLAVPRIIASYAMVKENVARRLDGLDGQIMSYVFQVFALLRQTFRVVQAEDCISGDRKCKSLNP